MTTPMFIEASGFKRTASCPGAACSPRWHTTTFQPDSSHPPTHKFRAFGAGVPRGSQDSKFRYPQSLLKGRSIMLHQQCPTWCSQCFGLGWSSSSAGSDASCTAHVSGRQSQQQWEQYCNSDVLKALNSDLGYDPALSGHQLLTQGNTSALPTQACVSCQCKWWQRHQQGVACCWILPFFFVVPRVELYCTQSSVCMYIFTL